MTTPTYPLDCPRCGRLLDPVCGHPNSAPWQCVPCRLSFWAAELTSEARSAYRPHCHDWGHGPLAVSIRERVQEERRVATSRGCALRSDQLGLVPAWQLKSLSALPLSVAFLAEIDGATLAGGLA